MNEQWTRWEPVTGLATRYSLEHVHDGMRGIEILLTDMTQDNKKVRVALPFVMISYTLSSPTGMPIHLQNTQDPHEKAVSLDGSFFEVQHSKYIEHLMEQSATIVEIYEPRHFVILTAQANINLVASYEPEVSHVTMDLATKTVLYKEMVIPYIIRNAPTARILLYESEEKKEDNSKLYLAIDCCFVVEQTFLKKIENDLQDSNVPLPCIIVDWQTLSRGEQGAVLKNGIVWRKSFDPGAG